MKTVLVALGLPIAPSPSVEAAITLARALSARLVACHVVTPPSPGETADGSERAARRLAELQRQLQQHGITIETRHVVGEPARRIIEMATLLTATYVVLGGPSGGGLGPVAARVLRETPCPAVVVPGLGQ